MAHIFLSYSRKDVATANRLADALTKAGYKTWMDREKILGGELWKERIVKAIDEARVFIVLLSPSSATSDEVRKELDIASEGMKPILPVVIADVEIPSKMRLSLAGLQKADFTKDPVAGQKQLLDAIQAYSVIEKEYPGWSVISKEKSEALSAILSDPSLSVREKIERYMSKYGEPNEARKAWQKKRDDLDAREQAYDREIRKWSDISGKLEEQRRTAPSEESRKLIEQKIIEANNQYANLSRQRPPFHKERMSLMDEAARERDAMMKHSRAMLEESNKLIERIWK
jgi:hypothetical protein